VPNLGLKVSPQQAKVGLAEGFGTAIIHG
jgi:hypothetical protein